MKLGAEKSNLITYSTEKQLHAQKTALQLMWWKVSEYIRMMPKKSKTQQRLVSFSFF